MLLRLKTSELGRGGKGLGGGGGIRPQVQRVCKSQGKVGLTQNRWNFLNPSTHLIQTRLKKTDDLKQFS